MILGMQLFAKTAFINSSGEIVSKETEGKPLRMNFDNLYNAYVTVFAVMIGDDWNLIMYDYKQLYYYHFIHHIY